MITETNDYPDRPTIEMVPRHRGGAIPTYWMIAMPCDVPFGPYATREEAEDALGQILDRAASSPLPFIPSEEDT